MNILIGSAAGNKEIEEIFVGSAAGNKEVLEVWVGTAAGNKLVYTSTPSYTAVPASLSGAGLFAGLGTVISTSASATIGSIPGTASVNWRQISGDGFVVAAQPNSPTTVFNGTFFGPGIKNAVLVADVTDGGETITSTPVSVTLEAII